MTGPRAAGGRPEPGPFLGAAGRVEKLAVERHGDSLWRAVAGHDFLWDFLAYGPFEHREAFLAWLATREALADPLCYAVLDPAGDCLGLATLMEIRPAMGVIEIGHILFSPAMQRTRLATEAVFGLMRHAFELGYRRFEWKCDDRNQPSKRAARRFGFTPEGLFRRHMIVKGQNRDTAWFSIIDEEWPARRAAFEAWSAPTNFDAAGRQIRPLAAGG